MTPSLAPPRTPFPVRTPFKTATDLYKLGRPLWGRIETDLFEFDNRFPATAAEKLAVLRDAPDHSLLYLQDDLPTLTDVLWRIAAAIANDQPTYAACDEQGFTSKLLGYRVWHDGSLTTQDAVFPELGGACAAYLQTLNGVDRLCAAIALSVQEDIVVMRNHTGLANRDQAEVLLVAIPSHWDPAEKLGQSFYEIHVPVGDAQRLLKVAPNLMDAIIGKGPFVRYNWSLSSVPTLCQNPALLENHRHTLSDPTLLGLPPADLLARLYFRVERQTLLSFTDVGRALFAIRIFQRPLTDALESTDHANQLANALASMSPGHLAYRSMTGIIEALVGALRGYRI